MPSASTAPLLTPSFALTAEMMGQSQQTKFRQVSFSGTTQAIQAVVKGDIPVYVDGFAPLVLTPWPSAGFAASAGRPVALSSSMSGHLRVFPGVSRCSV
ncbi:hypothetical protein [Cupriavidus pinatubonensis]|uniref:hypothetical protein n=1 Tax=Cupriavidus pinatubonensis TaxID=248026 RepID=UPI001FD3CA3D|nr:hypothetical protein [Cupriavidus pinatubonensis]